MRSRAWPSPSLRGPLCLPFVYARRLLAVCVPPFNGSSRGLEGGGGDKVTESERDRERLILIRMEAGRARPFICFLCLVSSLPFSLLDECHLSIFFSPSSASPSSSFFSFLCFFSLSWNITPFPPMSCVLHFFLLFFLFLSPASPFGALSSSLMLSFSRNGSFFVFSYLLFSRLLPLLPPLPKVHQIAFTRHILTLTLSFTLTLAPLATIFFFPLLLSLSLIHLT